MPPPPTPIGTPRPAPPAPRRSSIWPAPRPRFQRIAQPVPPRGRGYTPFVAQAPALPRGFELPLEPRLPRVGSVDQVAVEERAATLDQARGQAVGARDVRPHGRPDDARGCGHPAQGGGALLEGDTTGPGRPDG